MFETLITVIGEAATKPSRHALTSSGASLVEFDVLAASHPDAQGIPWARAETLSMRVVCQDPLSERVFASVSKGDPIIVRGRFRGPQTRDPVTRKWRTTFEIEAHHIGHDLSRGVAAFTRGDSETLTWPNTAPPPELDRVITGFGLEPAGKGA